MIIQNTFNLFKILHWPFRKNRNLRICIAFNYCSVTMHKPGFYAVKNGRIPGVYTTWTECQAQINGFSNAQFKKFPSEKLAHEFINQYSVENKFNTSEKITSNTHVKISSNGIASISDKWNATPNIYTSWNQCEPQVNSFSNDVCRKFPTEKTACEFSDSDLVEIKLENVLSNVSEKLISSTGISDKYQTRNKHPATSHNQYVPIIASSSTKKNKSYYAVHRGKNKGIYNTWTDCEAQIKDIRGACYRKFDNEEAALQFVKTGGIIKANKREAVNLGEDTNTVKRLKSESCLEEVTKNYTLCNTNKRVCVFTDGASSQNGKRNAAAGIGVFWGPNHPLNVSERLPGRQTNNRAEIYAAVRALNQAKQVGAKQVKLYTDSQFVIHGITDWINKWKTNGWKLSSGSPVINKEDFIELDNARNGLDVEWVYVRGHSHIIGNEEADKLAVAGAKLPLEAVEKPVLKRNNYDLRNKAEVKPIIVPHVNKKLSFYAVHKGQKPGVYRTWTECEKQVKNFPNPKYKKFCTGAEAFYFMKTGNIKIN